MAIKTNFYRCFFCCFNVKFDHLVHFIVPVTFFELAKRKRFLSSLKLILLPLK